MFLVVEIVNDKGEKEWKVAPKRWVCTTKNSRRTVLLWPREMLAERQMHLAKEGVCKPMKSWSRQECIVRQECSTYDGANAALQIQQQSEVHLKSMGASGVVAPEPSAKQDLPETKTSMLASIKTMVESLTKRHACIEQLNARIVKQNAKIEAQNIRIENESVDLKKTLQVMHKKLATLGSHQTHTEDYSTQSSSFYIEPSRTFVELNDLENMLNDEAFQSKMVAYAALEQQRLLANQSLPEKSWTTLGCVVKRKFKTIEEVNAAIEDMSGMSSSSMSPGPMPVQKKNRTKKVDFNHEIREIDRLTQPRIEPSANTSIITASADTAYPTTTRERTSTPTNTMEDICNRLQEITTSQQQIQASMNMLTNRIARMEKSVAEALAIFPTILEKIEAQPSRKEPKFSFNPIGSIKELEELEGRLNEENYKQAMINWLEWNVNGERSEKRMAKSLDLLFSEAMQAKCTWSGVSRGGNDRIALQRRRNIKHIFRVIGTTENEKVNDKMVAKFLINRLRNAKRRILWNGRNGTGA
ncbi:uncharacterized protein LOC126571747 [Anopheles aquasalis]|uniref:uncharacterized protein LOC126571747 n=1 Tax=Anopheles aquasalis TaxID=42839 RepID=UPI00215AE444|nr:uncharacterized protein LOC126571747 [Anopheles aquasalis]